MAKKVLNVLQVLGFGLYIISVVLFIIIQNAKAPSFMWCGLMLALLGLYQIIIIMMKEALLKDFDTNRYLPFMYAMHIILGVLCFFILDFLNYYDELAFIYWICYGVFIVVPFIVWIILNKKKDKNKLPSNIKVNK